MCITGLLKYKYIEKYVLQMEFNKKLITLTHVSM